MLLSVFIASCFFFPWNKFHYGDDKVKIIYKAEPIKDKVVEASVKIQKETIYLAPRIVKYGLSTTPVIEKKKKIDTLKSSIKYDLSHATVSQSAVGDNSMVTNNNYGIRQRHLTKDDQLKLRSILNSITNKSVILDFKVQGMAPRESQILGREINVFLDQMGFTAKQQLSTDDYLSNDGKILCNIDKGQLIISSYPAITTTDN